MFFSLFRKNAFKSSHSSILRWPVFVAHSFSENSCCFLIRVLTLLIAMLFLNYIECSPYRHVLYSSLNYSDFAITLISRYRYNSCCFLIRELTLSPCCCFLIMSAYLIAIRLFFFELLRFRATGIIAVSATSFRATRLFFNYKCSPWSPCCFLIIECSPYLIAMSFILLWITSDFALPVYNSCQRFQFSSYQIVHL